MFRFYERNVIYRHLHSTFETTNCNTARLVFYIATKERLLCPIFETHSTDMKTQDNLMVNLMFMEPCIARCVVRLEPSQTHQRLTAGKHDNTQGCTYSLYAPDDGRKNRPKHVEC